MSQPKMDVNTRDRAHVPIAIVGFSSIFPGEGTDPESFWQMLLEKRSAMTETPEDRVNMKGWHYPETGRPGRIYARGGNFIRQDVSVFDAPFFSLSANEASAMDPQQRHLLEVTYHALENAGIPIQKLSGSQTSVHVGCLTFDYRHMRTRDLETTSDYDSIGSSNSMIANRISWFFDCRGTSILVDTACSSSLVALDMACLGLQRGEAEMGIVAGSNLILSPDSTVLEGHATMLSPDSTSYSFDHRANGFSRGEGTATIILKRLDDAVRDGDTIRAVIRSTGSNNNGHASMGIMQPSEEAQVDLIRRTYEKAGLSMEKTRFCEAHGTGTVVGDSIEMNALGQAFQSSSNKDNPLIIGAVKSNIGHLEGASGLAGVIKTVLTLEKGIIPPNINFEKLSDKLKAADLPVKIPLDQMLWPTKGLRRASVNSFGIGGSNAHVVLDDALSCLKEYNLDGNHLTVKDPELDINEPKKDLPVESKTHTSKLLTFSAKDQSALKRLYNAYNDYFNGIQISIADFESYFHELVFTLNSRRSLLPCRGYLVTDSLGGLKDMKSMVSNTSTLSLDSTLGFAFTGQGAVWKGMGEELLAYPLFKDKVMSLDAELKNMGSDWSLFALTDLYKVCHIVPDVVIGHSSGEIGAAYAAGALSDLEALKIAYTRGVCISQMLLSQEQKGGMIAIGLGESDARTFISKVKSIHGQANLHVACINSPINVTVSGDIFHIDTLKALLDGDRIFARKINVPAAYHSPQMVAAIKPYNSMLDSLSETLTASLQPSCLMVSSVTGQPVSPKVLRSADYWCDNLLSPVRFLDAVTAATESNVKMEKSSYLFLEIGPHSVLKGFIPSTRPGNAESGSIQYAPSVVRSQNAIETFLSSVGQIHCTGLSPSLETVNSLDGLTQRQPKALADLPSYPFDHSKSYWRESRISKRFRLSDQGHRDLLGKPIADWNAYEAQRRNFVKVSELPWLEDHVVGGTLIYPAAGMMVMAIEAASQIAEKHDDMTGFMLKDVKFMQAMVIPDGPDGLETKVHLRKRGEASPLSEWAEFRIFSYGDESWKEHCTGFIRPEYLSYNEVDGGGDEIEALRREHEECDQRCVSSCGKSAMYKCLNDNGFGLGPAFQTVSHARYNTRGDSVAKVDVYQWPQRLHPQPHIIHPTTLDGILQITLTAITNGGSAKIPTAIPTSLRRLWVSKEGLSCAEAETISANGHIEAVGRGYNSKIAAMSSDLDVVLLKAEGLQSTSISSNSETSSTPTIPNSSCLNVKLLPAIQFMTPQTLNEYCMKQLPENLPDPVEFYQDVSFVVLKFLRDALNEVGDTLPSAAPSYLGRYLEWASLKQKAFLNHEAPLNDPSWPQLLDDSEYVSSVCDRVASFNAEGCAFVQIGKNLPSLLRGEMDPLQFLYKDDLLANFYEEWNNSWVGFYQCEAYLELLAHRNPEMKIIEIGAGTGGTTRKVLQALSTKLGHQAGEALYKSYDYTDISVGFFQKAKENFGHYPSINFRVFDVEKDATKQNLDVGTYDLVIAGSVLHATHEILTTMRNVRSLLKPGGKLIMLEPVHPEVLRGSFLGGLMEGWWTSDPNRPWNPTLTVSEWNEALQSAGFTGVETEFPDHINPRSQESSIIITEAMESPVVLNGGTRKLQSQLCFVGNTQSAHQFDIYEDAQKSIALELGPGSAKPDFCTFEECASRSELQNTTVVFLCDLEKAILQSLNESTFSQIRNIVGSCKNILWISGGGGKSVDKPEYSIVDGWARSLRSEKPTRRLVVLKLDSQNGQLSSHQVSHLVHMLQIVANDCKDDFYEPEIVEIDKLLHVPRVRSNALLKQSIFSLASGLKTEIMRLGDIGDAELTIGQYGLLDSLRWTTRPHAKQQPDELLADEIEIKVESVGLNFKDCLSALGRVPDTTLGWECAGIVSRAGVGANFSPGDRVLTYGAGLFKTFVRIHSSCVCRIPEEMDFTEAAAIPTQFVTAWRVINHIARLQKGESILIHAGAGGTGQAAIQIAQHVGAEIYATVGSLAKKELLMSEYNIPPDHIFYSRNANFADALMRRTNGRGVDVVMNSLAGPILVASWECIAAGGRFVEIGLKDILSNSGLPMAPFSRNATFTHFEGSVLTANNPSIFRDDIETFLPLFSRGILHVARPLHVMTVDKVEEAFRSLQKGSISGKIVLTMDPNSLVPTVREESNHCHLDSDATYLVIGGLGGLGRRISRWLVSRGARHLVLVGRSGGASTAAQELVLELEQSDAQVQAVSCDIVDLSAVQTLINHVEKTMPPIRGCVQAAMVLRDRMFQDMTLEDWELSLNCKVLGSWNLSLSLPPNLDFFIMLSSCSALIGPPGQANYSAANSYLDALARHLVSRGRKAISLDLGVMRDDGFLSEDPEFMKQVLTYGALETITREDFFAILDYYCNPGLPLVAPDFAQVAIGVPDAHSTGKLVHLVQEPPIFLPLRVLSGSSSSSSSTPGSNGTKADYRTLLKESDSLDDARQVMLTALVEKLDKICVFNEGDLDSDMHRPLTKLGVDSLVAVELGNWLKRYFEADVAVFELMGEETLSSLSLVVAQRSQLFQKS